MGEHELNSKVDSSNPYSQELPVQKVFIHADYSPVGKAAAAAATPTNSTTKNSWSEVANNADIALLKTADDLHWNEYVWPVCPPHSSSISSSGSGSRPSPKSNELEAREEGGGGGREFQQPRLATVIGWGKRSEVRSDFSDRLQKATVAIVGSRECEQWFRLAGRQLAISERILCAGWREGGRDSCHGDSGSPLLVRGTGKCSQKCFGLYDNCTTVVLYRTVQKAAAAALMIWAIYLFFSHFFLYFKLN